MQSGKPQSFTLLTLALTAMLSLGAPAVAGEPNKAPRPQVTTATWYGDWHRGRLTANGEVYDPEGMTAAHATLPLGTMVKVKRKANGHTVVVRINDRNAGQPGIDLSRGAARKLDMVEDGRARVTVTPITQLADSR